MILAENNVKSIEFLTLRDEIAAMWVKFEVSDSKKIARTLSAFANTDGGRLLIGVKDNGNTASVRSEELKQLRQCIPVLLCRFQLPDGI